MFAYPIHYSILHKDGRPVVLIQSSGNIVLKSATWIGWFYCFLAFLSSKEVFAIESEEGQIKIKKLPFYGNMQLYLFNRLSHKVLIVTQ